MSVVKHLRVIECGIDLPRATLIAYYDGRVDGYAWLEQPNWIDDGALSLGIASYALVSGPHALVYDTHVSVPHAEAIRGDLMARGVTDITVLLSHWHLDHVAGTAAFADCPVLATQKTLAHLTRHQAAIEDGSWDGPPAIKPLILPTRTFSGAIDLTVGQLQITVLEANIHSDDAAVVWVPAAGLLLAGDTMEDTITYVGAPQDFAIHLQELERLYALNAAAIFPNHGAPEVIAAGGYGRGLIKAQSQYIRTLIRCRDDAALRAKPLQELIAGPLQMGWVHDFAPYERVHAQNLERVLAGPGS